MQSLCQEADDRLNEFSDTLHLECLEMYKGVDSEFSDGGKENNDVAVLPQVSTHFYVVFLFLLITSVVDCYKHIVLCHL